MKEYEDLIQSFPKIQLLQNTISELERKNNLHNLHLHDVHTCHQMELNKEYICVSHLSDVSVSLNYRIIHENSYPFHTTV